MSLQRCLFDFRQGWYSIAIALAVAKLGLVSFLPESIFLDTGFSGGSCLAFLSVLAFFFGVPTRRVCGMPTRTFRTTNRAAFPPADHTHCAAAARLNAAVRDLSLGHESDALPPWHKMLAASLADPGNCTSLRAALLSKCLRPGGDSSPRETLNIGVVGGSMTGGLMNCHAASGVLCAGKFSAPDLTWSAQLQSIIAPFLPACEVHVNLRPTAAARIDVMLISQQRNALLKPNDDLLIEDYTVNDNKAPPSVAGVDSRARLRAGMEVLLREALLGQASSKQQQVIHLDVFPPQCDERVGRDETHGPIARHYAVPIVSLRRAVCENVARPAAQAAWNATWYAGCGTLDAAGSRCGVHPGPRTHRIIARLLAFYIVKQAAIATALECGGTAGSVARVDPFGPVNEAPAAHLAVAPFVSQQVLDSLQSCFVPLSYYDFSKACCETSCGKEQPLARNWTCYSERPDKPPGFITSTAGATLAFPRLKMSFGGKVVISFLRSYERMGSVRVALLDQSSEFRIKRFDQGFLHQGLSSWFDASDAVTLDGTWDSHTSQVQAAVIDNKKLWGNVSERQNTRTLGIRFDGGLEAASKFKVLSVETC